MEIKTMFRKFISNAVKSGKVELHNEAGLQFDFGVFIRDEYPESKIEFERNIRVLGLDKNNDDYYKSVVDLMIDRKIFVEFKFPPGSAIPRRTFQAIQDIAFLEKLKFKLEGVKCYSIFITSNWLYFDSSLTTEGIYRFFRKERRIYQPLEFDYPTFIDTRVVVNHDYCIQVERIELESTYFFYIIEL